MTITLVHDLKTNTVQLLEFPKLAPNAPPEPVTWAVRARQCLKTLLQRISEQISKKGKVGLFCNNFHIRVNSENFVISEVITHKRIVRENYESP